MAADLERLFADCFASKYNTRLCGGHAEPVYRPATANAPAQLCYREDFFRSALHEVAHWCVAGPDRRRLEDFGYWYEPDGRSAAQQAAFEAAEVRPQAFELIFCAAAGHPFRVSLDNLDNAPGDEQLFARRVIAEAERALMVPPQRMRSWALCLGDYYRALSRLPTAVEIWQAAD